jgi:FkbM family methyltransferase
MGTKNYTPAMTLSVERAALPGFAPFTLIDVGCSGGIHSLWRSFGGSLRAFAFDPDRAECERLQHSETNPNVRYFPMEVGLPPGHEFHRKKAREERISYFSSVLRRSSAFDPRFREAPPAVVPNGSSHSPAVAPPARIGLCEFFEQQALHDVDFIKVDTDGSDLEALLSAEACLTSHGILGFMVECMFQGSASDSSNTFHTIDRFMKRHGFMIYDLEVNRYSRAALPAPFVYNLPAQTHVGQPLWGDVVFLRDLVAPEYGPALPEISPGKILKLACLYEIFGIPDCAVELILRFHDRISPLINPSALLDLLTPSSDGQTVPYRDYIQAVSANPKRMFPGG